MRPRPLLAVAAVTVALTAACADRDDASPRPRPRQSSSTTASTTSTTTRPPTDLSAARFRLTPVADVDAPTAAADRAGDAALYVTEQSGRVRAIRDGALDPTPVLDLRDTISAGGERGLLGLDFSPDGSKLYVNYTNRDGNTRVDEYAMRADGTADRGSRRELLAIAQPQPNHNGGSVVTGPDGMLWIGTGDGGAAGDRGSGHAPEGNAQSPSTRLGKMLRIDPTPSASAPYSIPADNPYASGGGLPEVWADGLRNPWKYSFDRETGDLVIADVGQNAWEEIDWVPAATRGPLDFGWPVLEGTHAYRGDAAAGTMAPILEYSHSDGRCAISGGYVYRGEKLANLYGGYLYSDSCDGKIRGTLVGSGVLGEEIDFGLEAGAVVGFGEDAAGELYVLSQTDGVLRIDPA